MPLTYTEPNRLVGIWCKMLTLLTVIGHREHFATRVSERRRNLGLTLVGVNRNGGPTAPTLAKAEAGGLEDPRPSTLSKFDAGLRWLPGSAAGAYWEGDEPTPCDKTETSAVLEPADGTVALPLACILAIMTAQNELSGLIDDRTGQAVSAAEIRPLINLLNEHLSAVVGLFVTDLLERNYTERHRPMQPMLEFAFAELLSAPVSSDDPAKTEKLYRRWLLGCAEAQNAEFEASLRRRLRRRTIRHSG
jgi:hypothetical protein